MAKPRGWPSLALTAALTLFVGCDNDKPRAPVLATEAVYTNDAIGLTFMPPDGWLMYAKSSLPRDKPLDRPMRLVAYQKTEGTKRSEFELYAIEPGGDSLMAYLAKSPIGAEKWTAKGSPESLTINGRRAARYNLTSTRAEMRREITSFERGNRIYIFITTYQGADTKNREQTRRAVETSTWE